MLASDAQFLRVALSFIIDKFLVITTQYLMYIDIGVAIIFSRGEFFTRKNDYLF